MADGKRTRIGMLSEPVTIKRNTATGKNAYGEKSETLTDYMAGVWANVEPLDGSEAVRRGLTVEQHPTVFTIRWRSDKTPVPSDRVVWRTESYDTLSVADVNAERRFWRITTVKVV